MTIDKRRGTLRLEPSQLEIDAKRWERAKKYIERRLIDVNERAAEMGRDVPWTRETRRELGWVLEAAEQESEAE